MAEDMSDTFGVPFQGELVASYQTLPAIDGSYLGLRFELPDGSMRDMAIPFDALDRLQQEIARAIILCKERARGASRLEGL